MVSFSDCSVGSRQKFLVKYRLLQSNYIRINIFHTSQTETSRKFYSPDLNLEPITHLVLSCSKFLSICEIVDSDSKEDVEKSVVTEEREDDEVEGIDHAVTDPSLGHDPVVHDLVPVLPRQDLEDGEERDDEGVEVGVRCSLGEIKGAAEELHSE